MKPAFFLALGLALSSQAQQTINGTPGQSVTGVTAVGGVTISGTPSTGYVPTATSPTTATWQANSGGSGLAAPSVKPCVVGAQSSGTSTDCITYTFSGLDPTGATDETSTLNTQIAAHASGLFLFPNGTFKISGTIAFTRRQMWGGQGAYATQLNCTLTTGPCIVMADNTYGANNYGLNVSGSLTINGPGSSNTSSVGVYIGGDPAGVINNAASFGDNVTLRSLVITGFGSGVQYGNNAYNDVVDDAEVWGNYYGFNFPSGLTNSGEGMTITNTDIFNNTQYNMYAQGNPEMFWTNVLSDSGTVNIYGYLTLHCANCHFEMTSGVTNPPPFIVSEGVNNISITGSTFQYDGSGTCSAGAAIQLYGQGAEVVIENSNIFSSALCATFLQNNVSTSNGSGGVLGAAIRLASISGNYVGSPPPTTQGFQSLRSDTYPSAGQMLIESNIQAAFQWKSGQIVTNNIVAAGTGYSTGSTFMVLGTTGLLAVGTVTAQTGGVPSAINLNVQGYGYPSSTTESTVTLSGGGSGLTVGTGTVSGVLPVYSNPNLIGAIDVSNSNLPPNANWIDASQVVAQSVLLNYAGSTQGACNSVTEGTVWYTKGSGGTNGALQVCQNQSGTYSWVTH